MVTSSSSVRLILQSRCSSRRLPGKALLPVAGMPAVALAAKRAANTGLEVVVATSVIPLDDLVERAAAQAGVPVVRGNHRDVLSRFLHAARHMQDDDVIVRLTGDNLVPDGAFIDELLDLYTRLGGYVCSAETVPYGLSAEVFSVRALRRADREAKSLFDREHVTPLIARVEPAHFCHPRSVRRDRAHVRCTLDTILDYQRITRAFDGCEDPVRCSAAELIERIATGPMSSPRGVNRRLWGDGIVHSEFVLGTVQCGQSYGAANITGQPSYDECARIVENAIAHGVTAIDTARGYGDSETRLGTILESGLAEQVTTITKLSPLTEVLPTATDDECKMAVDASVYRSCRELRMRHLPVLLLHRWGHRNSNDGAIWRRLLSLRAEGIIGRIGASVGSPDQALEAIRDPEVTHIQLPLNALDYRWEEAGVPDALLARPELVVHARSSLLQGLLGAAADSWPAKEAALPFIDGLERAVKMLGRRDRVELAFAFVRSYSWVTSVVVGVETMEQLADCLRKFEEPALSVEERGEVRKLLPRAPASLLDPSRWARRPP